MKVNEVFQTSRTNFLKRSTTPIKLCLRIGDFLKKSITFLLQYIYKNREMNSLNSTKVVYKIQDLVIREEITSYKKFKIHFQDEIKFDRKLSNHRFINDLFRKIYTFLKELQKNPKSIILVQALRPLFEMLLFEMIIPEFIMVIHIDTGYVQKINSEYVENWMKSKITRRDYNIFTNPENKDKMSVDYQTGFDIWKKNKVKKYIETNGAKAYVKMWEEKNNKIKKELAELKNQKKKDGTYNEEDDGFDSYFFEFYDYKEYKDYLKTPNAVESC